MGSTPARTTSPLGAGLGAGSASGPAATQDTERPPALGDERTQADVAAALGGLVREAFGPPPGEATKVGPLPDPGKALTVGPPTPRGLRAAPVALGP
ncbi:MAG: hypothetical protein KF894_33760, partial [Labilithrix sp.]|nr:hypothetical protein [Labilithrix sp.]